MTQIDNDGMAGAQLLHRPSKMNAHQAQDYISLVVFKVDQLGEHYVARQLAWGTVEFNRLSGNEE